LPIDSDTEVFDFPDGILLPGLVNPHAHLELSTLRGRVPPDGGFLAWIRRIVDLKKDWTDREYAEAARAGLAELARHGVTTVGDHSQMARCYEPLRSSRLRGIVLIEFVNFDGKQAGEQADRLEQLIRECPESGRVKVGLAPHSPYAVSPALLRAALELAERHGRRMTIHLSEVREEIDFLYHGKGPFEELLRYRGMWDASWSPPGVSPIRYLKDLGFLNERVAGVHVNYLENGDLDLLREIRCPVIYCPNSHAFFRHPRHPLSLYLREGLSVGLGTDSLASNGRLSVMDEMRTVRLRFPEIPAERVLWMGTMGGAAALGWDREIGSLEAGKLADLTVVREGYRVDPIEWVTSKHPEVLMTVVDGEAVYKPS
jgi:cytosine/adenosine deaminase-related metal-dependent hydrolase